MSEQLPPLKTDRPITQEEIQELIFHRVRDKLYGSLIVVVAGAAAVGLWQIDRLHKTVEEAQKQSGDMAMLLATSRAQLAQMTVTLQEERKAIASESERLRRDGEQAAREAQSAAGLVERERAGAASVQARLASEVEGFERRRRELQDSLSRFASHYGQRLSQHSDSLARVSRKALNSWSYLLREANQRHVLSLDGATVFEVAFADVHRERKLTAFQLRDVHTGYFLRLPRDLPIGQPDSVVHGGFVYHFVAPYAFDLDRNGKDAVALEIRREERAAAPAPAGQTAASSP